MNCPLPKGWTHAEIDQWSALRASGMPVADIAAKMGRSTNTLYKLPARLRALSGAAAPPVTSTPRSRSTCDMIDLGDGVVIHVSRGKMRPGETVATSIGGVSLARVPTLEPRA